MPIDNMSGHLSRLVYGAERERDTYEKVERDQQVKVKEHNKQIACCAK